MNVNEPGHYNIRVNQGSSFAMQFTWKDALSAPINLSGCSGHLDISKKRKGLSDFTLEHVFSFTTALGNMVLNASLGGITCSATSVETALFDWDDAVYDLYIAFGSGEVVRLLDGHVVLSKALAT